MIEFAVWRGEISEELADARIALHEADDQLVAASQAASTEKRAIAALIK